MRSQIVVNDSPFVQFRENLCYRCCDLQRLRDRKLSRGKGRQQGMPPWILQNEDRAVVLIQQVDGV